MRLETLIVVPSFHVHVMVVHGRRSDDIVAEWSKVRNFNSKSDNWVLSDERSHDIGIC